jgi:hypothetical protein
MRAVLTFGLLSVFVGACATEQGFQPGGGETATGGAGGAGAGSVVTGGAYSATGGTAPITGGAGGVPSGEPCPNPGEKRCGGVCVAPSPETGCSLDTCTACPTIANGQSTCLGTTCDYTCNVGYTRSSGSCVPTSGTGGDGNLPDGCSDGIKNGSETDVDCGGAVCPACAAGRECSIANDCQSLLCEQDCFLLIFCSPATCQPGSCNDGLRNNDETDVDCGGSCTSCEAGQSCSVDGDCQTGTCEDGTCACLSSFACPSGVCGLVPDGCGATADCGGCPGTEACIEGLCVCEAGSCEAEPSPEAGADAEVEAGLSSSSEG